MDLSELTAYAEEKYHISEQHKWKRFPSFSVLSDPNSGKWLAVLMRVKDPLTGNLLQKCDIKCGAHELIDRQSTSVSKPFRMNGKNWIGVNFDKNTDKDLVFRLFDAAVGYAKKLPATIVLENSPVPARIIGKGTAIPFSKTQPIIRSPIPQKILEMMRLYRYNSGSFELKCENFIRQGKFMENYTDTAPWHGAFKRYFPTYHDLNVKQLRGYFTWRTEVRKGTYQPICASLAYIYLYELLNGIGVMSPQDTLDKMQAFQSGFIDSGVGDECMAHNLRRWMFEFAVINGLDAQSYAPPESTATDNAYAVLRNPDSYKDEDVCRALFVFGSKNASKTPVTATEDGRHLFAQAWRNAVSEPGGDFFTECFGKPVISRWYPLSNAVYLSKGHSDAEVMLNECRKYMRRDDVWYKEQYETLDFNKNRFSAFLRETDRLLRKFLKTGRYLRERPEEAWADTYVRTAIVAAVKAKEDALKPKVEIDLSGLDKIRRESLITGAKLLTEEDMPHEPSPTVQTQTDYPPPETPEIQEAPFPGSRLEPIYADLLRRLLAEGTIKDELRDRRLLPSVVADGINEAFYNLIGDSVVISENDDLALVDDYTEDVTEIMKGARE